MLPHACVSKTQIVLKMSANGRQVGVGFVTPSWFSDTDQHIGFGEEEKNKEFQFTSDHQIFISMVRNQTSYDRTGLTCVCYLPVISVLKQIGSYNVLFSIAMIVA